MRQVLCCHRAILRLRRFSFVAALAVVAPVFAAGQAGVCPAVASHTPTEAETAYAEGHYQKAEDLFGGALVQKPGDPVLTAALMHAELHLGEVGLAASLANKMLAADPHSAASLTALAEVELHQGQPWAAMETLDAVENADPCVARAHWVRSRLLRLDSMYASERVELDKAYGIDPGDPDIRSSWLGVVSPARQVDGVAQALATMKDLDAETRQKAEESIRSLLPMVSETSQTCQVLPAIASTVLPLQISAPDPKHIDGYRLEVKFPQGSAKLTIDTAASGIYVSRQLAELNHFEARAGDPGGTVHVDLVQIGPLEFRDCIVGVSDAPFPNHGDGSIGTDMFAQYLITLDHPAAKLTLAPLPVQAAVLPGDRMSAPELQGFAPVYHRRQFLLAPVTVDGKVRKLFVLDSGIRLRAMTPDVAHSVSNTKIGFTNPMQTTAGSTVQIYRDSFDFAYANLTLTHQSGVLEFEPSAIERSAGFEVAGMLGFDMLHSLVLHLDYRDGLVKLESANPELAPGNRTMLPRTDAVDVAEACPTLNTSSIPLNATIEAKVPNLVDAGHLKPGKEIYVTAATEWSDPECILHQGATIYGRVMAASAPKNTGSAQLAVQFDHADCVGQDKKKLAMRLIGLAVPTGDSGDSALHSVLPTEIQGRGRQVSQTAAMLEGMDIPFNAGGPPNTVHPGIVVGMPGAELEPLKGPGCSDRILTSEHTLRLGPGTVLVLERVITQR